MSAMKFFVLAVLFLRFGVLVSYDAPRQSFVVSCWGFLYHQWRFLIAAELENKIEFFFSIFGSAFCLLYTYNDI